jgi:hypothetical protein
MKGWEVFAMKMFRLGLYIILFVFLTFVPIGAESPNAETIW